MTRRLVLTFLFFAAGLMAAQTDRYVSTIGNDSNDGTASDSAHAWLTIGHADSLAQAGWTIHVAPGIYIAAITTSASGNASAPVVFVSDVKWGAHLTLASGTDTWTSHGSYVTIQNFDIDGGATANHGILVWGSNTKIIGNKVHDIPVPIAGGCSNGGAGIDFAQYTASNNDAIGNLVNNIGTANLTTACGQGIYAAMPNGNIYNNIVSNTTQYAIQLWHNGTNYNIVNNTIFHINSSVGTNATGGILIGCGDAGCVISDNNHVNNNIVRDCGIGIREEGVTGTHNTYLNNLVYNDTTSWMLQNGNTNSGTVTTDPLFVNYLTSGTGDYHLTLSSPARDAGTSSFAPTTDFDGVSRPQGAGYDIGAYEFPVSGATRPNPPTNLSATVK